MDSIVHGVTSSRTLLSRLHFHFLYCKASQVALEVKNPPANAGDIETWVQPLGSEDPLEKKMATHASIIAWRISWTEELHGLIDHGAAKSQT